MTAGGEVAYVPVRTQFENLGDVLICLGLLDHLRARGPVRVVGDDVPPALAGLLGVTAEPRLTRAAWWRGLLGGGRRALVLKPGGLVAPRDARERLGFLVRLAMVAAVRASGARAFQFAYSATDLPEPWRLLERAKARLLTASLPRDAATAAASRLPGEPVPDAMVLSPDPTAPAAPGRDLVVVSLRADRDGVGAAALPGLGRSLADAATGAGLTVCPVTQVGRDAAATEALARGAGVEAGPAWDPADPTSRAALYRAYARAEVVVSNRLHVLLVAWIHGCRLVAVVDHPRSKLPGALAATGAAFATARSTDPVTLDAPPPSAGAWEAAAARLRRRIDGALA